MTPAPEALLGWLLEASLALAAAIVLVLALGPALRRWAGPGAVLGLWALPLAALLAVSLPARSVHQAAPMTPPVAVASDIAASTAGPVATGAGQAPRLASAPAWVADALPGLLAATWLAGAALSALALLRQQRRFLRALGPLRRAPDGTWRAASSHLGPLALGVLRPRVVLPADFEHRYSPRQQALVIAHERVHVARGDLLANFAAAVARVVFWFHPLVHLAAERLRHDQELACDAAVLRLHPDARRAYADAVLDTQLAVLGLPVGCRWQSSHPLHRRLIMLKHPSPGRLRARLGTDLALALTAGAAGAAWAVQPARVVADEAAPAVASVPAPAPSKSSGSILRSDTHAPPAPPAPAAPPAPPAPRVAAAPPPPAPAPLPPAPPAPAPAAVQPAQPAMPAPPSDDGYVELTPAVARWAPAPRYPISARDDRRAGEVVVRAAVDADGRATPLGVEDAGGLGRAFERRALAAVRDWRFEPARIDGRAVASEVVVPVVFTPPRDFDASIARSVPLPYSGGLWTSM